MAIYRQGQGTAPDLLEQPIYGMGRLGVYYRALGRFSYQLADHLGNVRAVVVDAGGTAVSVTGKTDYYPFGMPMPGRHVDGGYRYAYQGQEKDDETGREAFELRLWDARIGRWLTVDPYRQFHSPYLGMGNNPISMIDPDGGWKTKFGRLLAWIGNGFKGKFYNSNVSDGEGKYGIYFAAGKDGRGTFMVTSQAGLDSWNRNQEWGNLRFTPEGRGYFIDMMREYQFNFFGRIEKSLNESNSVFAPLGKAAYGTADDFYAFWTHFDLLSPNNQPQHLNGRVIVRGSNEGIKSGINGLITTATFGRIRIPSLNAAQFSSKFKGTLSKLTPQLRGIINRNMNKIHKYWGKGVVAPFPVGLSKSLFERIKK